MAERGLQVGGIEQWLNLISSQPPRTMAVPVPQTEAGLITFMEEWLTELIGPLSAEGADRPDRRKYWATVLSNQKKGWRKRIRAMLEHPDAEWRPLYFHVFEDIVRCAARLSALTLAFA
jgi:hypothetical protein